MLYVGYLIHIGSNNELKILFLINIVFLSFITNLHNVKKIISSGVAGRVEEKGMNSKKNEKWFENGRECHDC